ncbi:MAG: DUF368 domain-containing protein [Spirochaetaceae bacterium]
MSDRESQESEQAGRNLERPGGGRDPADGWRGWPTVVAILANLGRGVTIGVANVIPGVSGGTLAVVLRIYEKLITSVRDVLSFRKGWPRRIPFLAQIALGVGVGIVGLARVIEYLLATHAGPTQLFFIGLILGSVPALLRQSGSMRVSVGHILAFVIALSAVIGISLLTGAETTRIFSERSVGTAGLLVASGIAGAAAMVVPGISGSFLLLLIGTYATIIHGINQVDPFILGATAVGVLVGLALITRLIAWLFRRAPGPTYAAILGLVAGSLVRLWPGVLTGLEWLWGAVAVMVGAASALLLGGRNRGGGERADRVDESGDGRGAAPNAPAQRR